MKAKIAILLSLAAFSLYGCNDLLDRPTLTSWNDENFWSNEDNVKLYAYGFYDHSFIGYNQGWTVTATPHRGFTHSDDIVYNGTQSNFTLAVPNGTTGSSVSTSLEWSDVYSGLGWNFVWVRKANVMIDRLENQMKNVLSTDAYNHWMGIARFFKAIEYAGLVSTFGDVPYYESEVGSAERDELYKPRTPRNEVMDAVYDDFVFALEHVGGTLTSKLEVNTYVVAGFVSRWALFEGTWQKYHENNSARSQKFLDLAVRASEVVMNSGRFSFNTDFRSLFGSESLSGSGEVILYRHYDASYSITHCIASECNLMSGTYEAPSLALVKSFICNDGSDWQTSQNAENKNFEMSNLIKTRDPRFEATFFKRPTYRAFSACIYTAKFINREGHYWVDIPGMTGPSQSTYTSYYNTNDYPILRYAEIVLNWIEAKAELGNVTQTDIDRSINAIRNRPLAADAVAAGVQRTAALDLSNLPNSPNRGDVSQLLWEIRRERRMEFAFEYGRLQDLRRWKKLEYMDGDLNPDLLRGTWVTIEEYQNNPLGIMHLPPDSWKNDLKGIIGVVDMDGNETVFDGTNTGIQGFFFRTTVRNRRPFLNLFNVNPYLAPVGRNQRQDYENKGYYLSQTPGWPDEF